MANNCKIFTPTKYVKELLDSVGYKSNKSLFDKYVLENSCGDGNVLSEVVDRYIKSALKDDKQLNEIAEGLEKYIYGVELETEHAENCKKNLDHVARKYGIYNVRWNIIEGNYLKQNIGTKFSYIIGNPPYISYRDIEKEERKYLQEKFASCKDGKFDYYYAFIEKSISDMSLNGRMAYIIPSSIYKNVFASNLRKIMKPYVEKIYDYTYQTKFPGTTTSSTILVLKKQHCQVMKYYDVAEKKCISLNKDNFTEKWEFVEKVQNKGTYNFGDYFNVSNTIATLCNEAFLLEDYKVENGFYVLNDDKVERDVVRTAVSRRRGKKMAIIFPYYFKDGKIANYSKEEFELKYPYAVRHLKKFEKKLQDRAADKNAEWFEYGRSQAISKMNEEKLMLPSILTSNVVVTKISRTEIPCAGFIITQKGNLSLDYAKNILESTDFYEYLKRKGIYTTGKSRRLTTKDIAEYTFDM